MSTESPKAYSYLRFSTPRQVKGDSFRRQVDLARNYAAKHGLILQDLSFHDLGVSAFRGTNREHGSLGKFIELVRSGVIDKGSYLLIESFDRLSRQDVELALPVFLEVINLGIVVVTLVDSNVFKAGEMDLAKLVTSIVYMSRANEESEIKSRRAKASWATSRIAAAEKGLRIKNSALPAWLDWNGDEIVPKEHESAVIAEMLSLSAQGWGYERIAAYFNAKKITTFRDGKPWRSAGIGAILLNPAIIGQYQPHEIVNGKRQPVGEPITDYYPAIVSKHLFMEVKQKISNRTIHSGSYRRGRYQNLFSGLLRCQCGEMLALRDKGKDGTSRLYLECPGKRTKNCSMRNIRYERFEPQVLVALSHMAPVMSARNQRTEHERAHLEAKADQELLIQRLNQNAERLTDIMLEVNNPERFRIRLLRIESEIASAKELLAKHNEALESLRVAASSVVLLTAASLDSPEERSAFNSQLHASLGPIQVLENGDSPIVRYQSKLGEWMFEQSFRDKLAGSTVLDMDGMTLCMTKSEAPFIDTAWHEDLMDESSIR